MPGIYGSKKTESEGIARGQGLFTTAINPRPPVLKLYITPDWFFVVIIINTSVHVQVFTVTAILFTVTV